MYKKVRHHIEKVPVSLRQFIKFSLVGVANTTIDIGFYLFFTRVFGIFYLVANILAFLIAVTNSYFLNRRFTFKSKQNKKLEYSLFVVVQIVGLLIAELILYVSVTSFGWIDIHGKLVAVVIVIFWNFIASKNFVFKIRKKPKIFG